MFIEVFHAYLGEVDKVSRLTKGINWCPTGQNC